MTLEMLPIIMTSQLLYSFCSRSGSLGVRSGSNPGCTLYNQIASLLQPACYTALPASITIQCSMCQQSRSRTQNSRSRARGLFPGAAPAPPPGFPPALCSAAVAAATACCCRASASGSTCVHACAGTREAHSQCYHHSAHESRANLSRNMCLTAAAECCCPKLVQADSYRTTRSLCTTIHSSHLHGCDGSTLALDAQHVQGGVRQPWPHHAPTRQLAHTQQGSRTAGGEHTTTQCSLQQALETLPP